MSRSSTRVSARRHLVTRVENGVDGVTSCSFSYAFDAAGRPVMRNDDVFGYNMRGEVAHATISDNQEAHAYDLIGNSLWASFNSATNTYTANNLNQYTSILRASVPPCELSLSHDADGNLVSFDPWSYAYDSGSRLTVVASNGVAVVANAYDHRGRRVRKTTRDTTHTFIYDDWNLILEHVARMDGTTNRIEYVWGRDVSGTLQGAGGVGALLYVKIDGAIHVPFYDAYGNIVQYRAADGSLSAAYTYDAFGRIISQNGPLAGIFRHRFSSKYFDDETGLYYYGYRFYSPVLRCWLARDPKGEDGGINLYCFVSNAGTCRFDQLGMKDSNLFSVLSDAWCEEAYSFAKKFLHTPQELAAWNRYTNHDWRGRNRDISLKPEEVKQIAESNPSVVAIVDSQRTNCSRGISAVFEKSVGGSAPAPWVGAIGGVSILVRTECSSGCFSYSYTINDLYDFDFKGIPKLSSSRDWYGEGVTLGVNLTRACLRCNWESFYHKGTYSGK